MKAEDMGVLRGGDGEQGMLSGPGSQGVGFGAAHTSIKWLLSVPNGHSIAVQGGLGRGI